MEPYPEEDYNYSYEHDVREIIEQSKEDTRVRSFYDPKTNTWEVEINYGEYVFNGTVSSEGVPIEGLIVHNNESVSFQNNQILSKYGFAETIMRIFQDKINERFQEQYEEEEEEEEEIYCNRFEEKMKAKRERAATEYQNEFGSIQEQDHESGSEDEGENVIHENTINENPTPLTQQHQNQSNLNLKSGQSRKFGRSNSK